MVSIYIAAPWVNKQQSRQVRTELEELGHRVTSRWLDEEDSSSMPEDPEYCQRVAKEDLRDIDDAHLFLILTDERPVGGGHHVELGYALAREKHIVVVGPAKSVFHHLAHHIYPDWGAAKKEMRSA